jgi:predicted N-acetyltransferase YhbS
MFALVRGLSLTPAFWEATAMITIREETFHDVEAREALLDTCFGPARFQKTCERLREGRMPADGLSLVIDRDDEIIGTVRLWHVSAGPNRPALMLGPIAIDPSVQSLGLGGKLMREALARAAARGHKAVLLVGDAPYYERFGFSLEKTGSLWLPGPYERNRFLALELEAGSLDGARGLVSATGAFEEKPDLSALVAAAAQGAWGGMRPGA